MLILLLVSWSYSGHILSSCRVLRCGMHLRGASSPFLDASGTQQMPAKMLVNRFVCDSWQLIFSYYTFFLWLFFRRVWKVLWIYTSFNVYVSSSRRYMSGDHLPCCRRAVLRLITPDIVECWMDVQIMLYFIIFLHSGKPFTGGHSCFSSCSVGMRSPALGCSGLYLSLRRCLHGS